MPCLSRPLQHLGSLPTSRHGLVVQVINVHYTQPLPPIAPPGDYMVHVIAYDDQRTELMCVAVNFTLTMPEVAAAGGAGAGAGGAAAAVERARAAFADIRQLVAAGGGQERGQEQEEQVVEKVVRRRLV